MPGGTPQQPNGSLVEHPLQVWLKEPEIAQSSEPSLFSATASFFAHDGAPRASLGTVSAPVGSSMLPYMFRSDVRVVP